jgi:hypothetical protein
LIAGRKPFSLSRQTNDIRILKTHADSPLTEPTVAVDPDRRRMRLEEDKGWEILPDLGGPREV